MTDVIAWARQYLISHNYTLKTAVPETIQTTPWSLVVRFITENGFIYLKQTPALIALEADIIQVLQRQFRVSVPQVIAHNTELNCFLMKDAGTSLREILKKQFDVLLVCKAIKQFTAMQSHVVDYVDSFINMGVPDWRLDKMPSLYQQFVINNNHLLLNFLVDLEIQALKDLIPTITDLCEKLLNFGIKQTIVQPDFNDNNTLRENNGSAKITLIDLGEIVISHPFFSLINFLFQMRKHHGLRIEDENYQKILCVCLEGYREVDSKEVLLEAWRIAEKVSHVYGILAYARLMQACGVEMVLSFQHQKFQVLLKQLILSLSS